MLDGTDRVTFEDVYVLAQNDAVILCGVDGKVVGIPPRRVLPGSEIAARRDHGTLVLERAFAEVLNLLPANRMTASGNITRRPAVSAGRAR
jgi:hypothetical protein